MRKPSRCRRTAIPLLAPASGGSGRQPTLLSWRLEWPNRHSQDYASAQTERHLEAEGPPEPMATPDHWEAELMTTPDLLHAIYGPAAPAWPITAAELQVLVVRRAP